MALSHGVRLCTVSILSLAAIVSGTTDVEGSAAGAGAVAGSGTISPGLGILPAPQSITFSGTLTGTAVVGVGPVVVGDSCSLSGGSGALGGSIAADVGTIAGSCSGSLALNAGLSFARAGAVVALEGTGGIGGVSATEGGACLFATTQLPPITSYTLACAMAGAGP